MRFIRVIFTLAGIFLGNFVVTYGQDLSNKGTEFYITYPAHIDGTLSVMGIYITSDQAASGTVQVGNGGPVINFNIAANTVRRIFLGNTAANDAPNGSVYQDQIDGIKPGSAILVKSNQPVVVYAHIIRSARSGSSLILPSSTWGREYVVPSYWSTGASGAASGRGIINIVAKEPNTLVEIVPNAGSFNGSRQPGIPYTITLNNPGDVYQVQFAKDEDISGTLVRSIATAESPCKPIGVFSATTWSAFNCANALGGDNLYQQLFPTRSFGRTFITAPFANRQKDIYRVFTIEPGTIINKTENGVTTPLLSGAGGFAEFETSNPTRIVANRPISVVQYMNAQTCDTRNLPGCANNGTCQFPADPEMVILNPIEQTINNITLFSAHQNWVPVGQSNVNQCYLNIIIPTTAAASFRINNNLPVGNFVAIPGTGFSYLQENISTLALGNPVQQLTADSSFSCIAYGYGNVESYGYNAGTNVKDLFQFLTIRDPNQSLDFPAACQLTKSKLFLTLPYPATKLEWKFNGLFPDVVINNPVADSTYQREGKTLYRFALPGEYTFPNTGTYKIVVIATNPTSDGCTGELQIDFDITVRAKPSADFNFNYTSCVSDSARFISSGNVAGPGESLVKWHWNFGDNTTGTGASVSHKYANAGTFTVAHTVGSVSGCVSDTLKLNVVANPKPVAAFTLTGPYCLNQNINFSNTSTTQTGTITRWYWSMGNGQILDRNTGTPFTYAYPAVGTYIVKLVVTTNAGCVSDTVQQTITVGNVPVPGFTLPDVCLNDAFANFTNTTTIADGTLAQTTWLWNFGNPSATPGNPNTSTLLNGRHNYNDDGTYQVKLVATSNAGCKDSITQTLTVNGGNPLAAFDIVNPGNICSNETVQIRNKSTVNFGKITRVIVYWNFGTNNNDTTMDNSPVTDRIYAKSYPTFSSPATKQIQVRLRAFSGLVCVNEITKTIVLNAVPDAQLNTIPGICFDANPRQLTQGFDAGNSPGQGIYSGPGISPAGIFDPKVAGVGTHTVKFKYITSAGCSDSTSGTITVWPQPTSNFTISPATCINAPITLTSTSVANVNNIVAWDWDYGDGQTELRTNGNAFTRTYTTLQNYNITLRVSTDSGCSSNLTSRTISINPLPIVDFDLPTFVCLPQGRAAFTNKTTVTGSGGTPLTYLWNFGLPGATSTQTNPVYNYSAAGPYTVSLRATSARGCADSTSKVLNDIYSQLMANFSANPPEVCIGDAIQFQDLSNPLNNTITSWNWSFGDGGTSNLQNPVRTYSNTGTFTVRMYYNTDTGCPSDTATRTVIVHPYPVVDAGPDQVVLQGGEVMLQATVSGSTNYQYVWTPSTWLNNPNILQPISKAEDDITYTLTVTGAGNCSAFDTVFVLRLLKPIIPNVFSPNNDGINDTWIIRYLDSYPGATVQVFDRYGRAIIRTEGYNTPWNGTNGGTPVPAGVYYYIVDPKNGLKPITGSLTIIR
jgi:gliding motility-associated-like protein